eukprot:scaffold334_cov356-Prasinococcus_capsulatus_cf.AAC.6
MPSDGAVPSPKVTPGAVDRRCRSPPPPPAAPPAARLGGHSRRRGGAAPRQGWGGRGEGSLASFAWARARPFPAGGPSQPLLPAPGAMRHHHRLVALPPARPLPPHRPALGVWGGGVQLSPGRAGVTADPAAPRRAAARREVGCSASEHRSPPPLPSGRGSRGGTDDDDAPPQAVGFVGPLSRRSQQLPQPPTRAMRAGSSPPPRPRSRRILRSTNAGLAARG